MEHRMREDLASAAHTFAHPSRPKPAESKEHDRDRPLKHFHAQELHDGTYHVKTDYGEGQMETGSANDLDEVHDHLEEMMGDPTEG